MSDSVIRNTTSAIISMPECRKAGKETLNWGNGENRGFQGQPWIIIPFSRILETIYFYKHSPASQITYFRWDSEMLTQTFVIPDGIWLSFRGASKTTEVQFERH